MKYTKTLAAVAGTAAALTLAPTAHADEATFLKDVAAHGSYAGPEALTVGHQVCTSVSQYGTDGLDTESLKAINAGVSAHDAAVLITSAVWDLCPSNMPAFKAWVATPVSES
jgi:Protein of unknown function (DUF732)